MVSGAALVTPCAGGGKTLGRAVACIGRGSYFSQVMELVQLTADKPDGIRARQPERKPPWLKVQAPGGPNYVEIRRLMRDLDLHTVCEEARCPNIGECWEHRAATFMVLGDKCTRNCAYCAVSHGTPTEYDPDEPARLARAVEKIGLNHVVITSVDRDDLPNGGAEIFAACVHEIRSRLPHTSVELLIPDFKGSEAALRMVVTARPDILNHNLETVQRLYRIVPACSRTAPARKNHGSRVGHQVGPHVRSG